jgi:hypothetical protein
MSWKITVADDRWLRRPQIKMSWQITVAVKIEEPALQLQMTSILGLLLASLTLLTFLFSRISFECLGRGKDTP